MIPRLGRPSLAETHRLQLRRRVVVTGLGLVTPLGLDVESTWSAILAGKSGVVPITRFDTSEFRSRIGGLIDGLSASAHLGLQGARRTEPFVHYGVDAAVQALSDARLEVSDDLAPRVGVIMGSGIGGLEAIERERDTLMQHGPDGVSPMLVPQCIINILAAHISILTGAQGPSYGMVSACASGAHSIGDAARMIERGDVDIMIAGSAEAAVTPVSLAGFSAARALSQRNDDPERASRPWDRDRDGFVLADGAGVVILEALDSALERGAPIYAELLGYGATGDAHHITMPSRNGVGARRCMEAALVDGGVYPEDVSYINAHATSTRAGDLAEAQALEGLFGARLPQIPVSSTKSMTGHLLGAAGSVEAVFSILAIRDQILPPTINTKHIDVGCELDIVPGEARSATVNVTLSNSFGFGGTNAVLLFGRFGAASTD